MCVSGYREYVLVQKHKATGDDDELRRALFQDLLHGHAVKHPLQAAAAGGNKLSANVEGKKIRAARPW